MIEELPVLTIWQQIGFILATPGYDSNGAAFLDEGDTAEIARLLDTYKAATRAERDALRDQVAELREDLRECRDERDAATTF